MAGRWLQAANKRMDEKGSRGSFGPATEGNIRAGLKAGGKRAKKAAFAKAMKTIAKRREKKGRHRKGRARGRK